MAAAMDLGRFLSGYDVCVLRDGFCRTEPDGSMMAGCSITLVRGPTTVLVDPGSPWETQILLEGLAREGVKPEDVQYVVCTHGHLDHVGNLNLFPHATHIMGYDLAQPGNRFLLHDFKSGIPYEIDDHTEVRPTPGHTGSDVSVVVRGTHQGTVVIAGDIYEKEEDVSDASVWREVSEQPEVQQASRRELMGLADIIVPGHGPAFTVTQTHRQMILNRPRTAAGPCWPSKRCRIEEMEGGD